MSNPFNMGHSSFNSNPLISELLNLRIEINSIVRKISDLELDLINLFNRSDILQIFSKITTDEGVIDFIEQNNEFEKDQMIKYFYDLALTNDDFFHALSAKKDLGSKEYYLLEKIKEEISKEGVDIVFLTPGRHI